LPAPASSSLPPGPRAPSLVQTLMILRDPVGFLERCRSRYGPVFRVRFVSFTKMVYVAEPDLARRVFASDRDVGHAGDVRREFLEPLVGANSVLCLEGDQWLRQRKLLAPAFHGRAVAGYRDEIAGIAARHVERWPLGEPFALRPRMQAITLEVILRLVFGIRDAGRLKELGSLLPPLIDAGGSFFIWVLPAALRERLERSPRLQRLPGSPMRRFYRLRERADAIVYDEIAHRRARPDDERTDVLSMLLAARDEHGAAMNDEELRDELGTRLEAGHETTATALAWTFERLSRHPDAVERLRSELADGEETYLDAVIKETLRSRPVVFDAPRRLSGTLELDGYRVPAGWYVAPAIPLVHRAPDVFPEPDRFSPERFLGDETPVEGWIPFGGGRRRCLGSQLALMEMRTVIGEVLRQVELHAADPADEAARLRHVTLVPGDLTRVVARPAPGVEKSLAASGAAASA
jgi:cytochrome P450 family 135